MKMSKSISLKFPKPQNVFNKQVYDDLFNYSSRVDIWYGGAASGKSHGVVQKAIIKALGDWKYPRRFLVLRKIQSSLEDSIFQDFIERLSDWGILEYCDVRHSNNRRIILPNGSEFLFKGLDNPEKIKSVKGVSDIIMEEATEFTLDDFTQLNLRLREKKHAYKQIFIMFNPISKVNWVYKTFFEHDFEGAKIHLSTYKDNRFNDEETRKTIERLAETNEAYYKIYALGEFATLDKLIFPKYEKRLLNSNSQEMRRLSSYFGLDFGYTNDISAFIHVKVDKRNRTLYVMQEYTKNGMLNDEIAQMIKSLGYSKEVIYADAAEPKSIDELRRDGIKNVRAARKGKDSIVFGISYLQQFHIVIDERCTRTIEEFDNYTWKRDKGTNEYINEPDTSTHYDHAIDAIRYAISKLIFESKQNTTKKIDVLHGLGL